jgi:hypothetical protein
MDYVHHHSVHPHRVMGLRRPLKGSQTLDTMCVNNVTMDVIHTTWIIRSKTSPSRRRKNSFYVPIELGPLDAGPEQGVDLLLCIAERPGERPRTPHGSTDWESSPFPGAVPERNRS